MSGRLSRSTPATKLKVIGFGVTSSQPNIHTPRCSLKKTRGARLRMSAGNPFVHRSEGSSTWESEEINRSDIAYSFHLRERPARGAPVRLMVPIVHLRGQRRSGRRLGVPFGCAPRRSIALDTPGRASLHWP